MENKILINDTIRISSNQAQNWLSWMNQIVIPLLQNREEIESFRIHKILNDEAEDGITFACQYICPDSHTYSEFINNFDLKIKQEQNNRFQGHFGTFRTIMEVLAES